MGNSQCVENKDKERPGPPGQPHVYVSEGVRGVLVKWAPPTFDGNTPVTSYIVHKCAVGSNHWERAHSSPTKSNEIVIHGLVPGQPYQVRVIAENSIGPSLIASPPSEAFIAPYDQTLAREPEFVLELRDVTAIEGERVEFEVEVDGIPLPEVKFYKDGLEIYDGQKASIMKGPGGLFYLIFRTLGIEDSGEIKCVATNEAGEASSVARLQVEAPPRAVVSRQLEEGVIFDARETLRLRVSYTGRPTPEVSWYHEGVLLESGGRVEIETSSQSSTLKIANVRRADRGEYTVRLSSPLGDDSQAILVTITDRPTPPGAPSVTKVTSKSVELEWTPPEDDGGCKIGSYIVEYYRKGWNIWLKGGTFRQLTGTLNDLLPGSEYKFRVKAENPYGFSEPSGESVAIALPADPKSPHTTATTENLDYIGDETTIGSSILPLDGEEVTNESSTSEIAYIPKPVSAGSGTDRDLSELFSDSELASDVPPMPSQVWSAPELGFPDESYAPALRLRQVFSDVEFAPPYSPVKERESATVPKFFVDSDIDLLSGIGSSSEDFTPEDSTKDNLAANENVETETTSEANLEKIADELQDYPRLELPPVEVTDEENLSIDGDSDDEKKSVRSTATTAFTQGSRYGGFLLPKSPARMFVHEQFLMSALDASSRFIGNPSSRASEVDLQEIEEDLEEEFESQKGFSNPLYESVEFTQEKELSISEGISGSTPAETPKSQIVETKSSEFTERFNTVKRLSIETSDTLSFASCTYTEPSSGKEAYVPSVIPRRRKSGSRSRVSESSDVGKSDIVTLSRPLSAASRSTSRGSVFEDLVSDKFISSRPPSAGPRRSSRSSLIEELKSSTSERLSSSRPPSAGPRPTSRSSLLEELASSATEKLKAAFDSLKSRSDTAVGKDSVRRESLSSSVEPSDLANEAPRPPSRTSRKSVRDSLSDHLVQKNPNDKELNSEACRTSDVFDNSALRDQLDSAPTPPSRALRQLSKVSQPETSCSSIEHSKAVVISASEKQELVCELQKQERSSVAPEIDVPKPPSRASRQLPKLSQPETSIFKELEDTVATIPELKQEPVCELQTKEESNDGLRTDGPKPPSRASRQAAAICHPDKHAIENVKGSVVAQDECKEAHISVGVAELAEPATSVQTSRPSSQLSQASSICACVESPDLERCLGENVQSTSPSPDSEKPAVMLSSDDHAQSTSSLPEGGHTLAGLGREDSQSIGSPLPEDENAPNSLPEHIQTLVGPTQALDSELIRQSPDHGSSSSGHSDLFHSDHRFSSPIQTVLGTLRPASVSPDHPDSGVFEVIHRESLAQQVAYDLRRNGSSSGGYESPSSMIVSPGPLEEWEDDPASKIRWEDASPVDFNNDTRSPELTGSVKRSLSKQGSSDIEWIDVRIPITTLNADKPAEETESDEPGLFSREGTPNLPLATPVAKKMDLPSPVESDSYRTAESGTYRTAESDETGSSKTEEVLTPKGGEQFDYDSSPVFIRSLSSQAVKLGSRVRLIAEVRSTESVEATWYFNDAPLAMGPRFETAEDDNCFALEINPVTKEDQGLYVVVAKSSAGVAKSSADIEVIIPRSYKEPTFLEELRAILTEAGTVALEVKVVGVPTPVLKWYKDGVEIRAGDTFALTAASSDPNSLGTYTCEAINCMGRAVSTSKVNVRGSTADVIIKRADVATPLSEGGSLPLFIEDLYDQKIKVGEFLTLAVRVSVPPYPLSIEWYNKNQLRPPSDKYHYIDVGDGEYCLEISPVELEDDGEWRCQVTSEGGVASSSCVVTLSVPKNYRKPRFLERLKAVLTEEGLVSFECRVVGFPTPQLRWFKDGRELKPGDVYQLSGTNSLGSYSCVAKNCMGEAESSAELTLDDIQNQLNDEERSQLELMNRPPQFIIGLKSAEAKVGDPYRFVVQVTAVANPTLTWFHEEEAIEQSERYTLTTEDQNVFYLDVNPVEVGDQGEWKCVALNDFGHSVTSCSLRLVIPRSFKKPRFLEGLRAVLSEEGTVNLECKVIGVPQPILKWFKDGVELKAGDIHRIMSGQDGTCCLGTYTCEAHNCMGTASSSAALLSFEEKQASAEQPVIPLIEHIRIARHPSLSTIQEEMSQLSYATHQTQTLEEKQEVSVSLDGREVSLSLYETPDLTEEEAQKVVDMFAEELSPRLAGGQNIVELPPLRFVRESSTAGRCTFEATVIDIQEPELMSAKPIQEEEDLRTEANIEEFSAIDNALEQLMVMEPVGSKLAPAFTILEGIVKPKLEEVKAEVPSSPPANGRKVDVLADRQDSLASIPDFVHDLYEIVQVQDPLLVDKQNTAAVETIARLEEVPKEISGPEKVVEDQKTGLEVRSEQEHVLKQEMQVEKIEHEVVNLQSEAAEAQCSVPVVVPELVEENAKKVESTVQYLVSHVISSTDLIATEEGAPESQPVEVKIEVSMTEKPEVDSAAEVVAVAEKVKEEIVDASEQPLLPEIEPIVELCSSSPVEDPLKHPFAEEVEETATQTKTSSLKAAQTYVVESPTTSSKKNDIQERTGIHEVEREDIQQIQEDGFAQVERCKRDSLGSIPEIEPDAQDEKVNKLLSPVSEEKTPFIIPLITEPAATEQEITVQEKSPSTLVSEPVLDTLAVLQPSTADSPDVSSHSDSIPRVLGEPLLARPLISTAVVLMGPEPVTEGDMVNSKAVALQEVLDGCSEITMAQVISTLPVDEQIETEITADEKAAGAVADEVPVPTDAREASLTLELLNVNLPTVDANKSLSPAVKDIESESPLSKAEITSTLEYESAIEQESAEVELGSKLVPSQSLAETKRLETYTIEPSREPLEPLGLPEVQRHETAFQTQADRHVTQTEKHQAFDVLQKVEAPPLEPVADSPVKIDIAIKAQYYQQQIVEIERRADIVETERSDFDEPYMTAREQLSSEDDYQTEADFSDIHSLADPVVPADVRKISDLNLAGLEQKASLAASPIEPVLVTDQKPVSIIDPLTSMEQSTEGVEQFASLDVAIEVEKAEVFSDIKTLTSLKYQSSAAEAVTASQNLTGSLEEVKVVLKEAKEESIQVKPDLDQTTADENLGHEEYHRDTIDQRVTENVNILSGSSEEAVDEQKTHFVEKTAEFDQTQAVEETRAVDVLGCEEVAVVLRTVDIPAETLAIEGGADVSPSLAAEGSVAEVTPTDLSSVQKMKTKAFEDSVDVGSVPASGASLPTVLPPFEEEKESTDGAKTITVAISESVTDIDRFATSYGKGEIILDPHQAAAVVKDESALLDLSRIEAALDSQLVRTTESFTVESTVAEPQVLATKTTELLAVVKGRDEKVETEMEPVVLAINTYEVKQVTAAQVAVITSESLVIEGNKDGAETTIAVPTESTISGEELSILDEATQDFVLLKRQEVKEGVEHKVEEKAVLTKPHSADLERELSVLADQSVEVKLSAVEVALKDFKEVSEVVAEQKVDEADLTPKVVDDFHKIEATEILVESTGIETNVKLYQDAFASDHDSEVKVSKPLATGIESITKVKKAGEEKQIVTAEAPACPLEVHKAEKDEHVVELSEKPNVDFNMEVIKEGVEKEINLLIAKETTKNESPVSLVATDEKKDLSVSEVGKVKELIESDMKVVSNEGLDASVLLSSESSISVSEETIIIKPNEEVSALAESVGDVTSSVVTTSTHLKDSSEIAKEDVRCVGELSTSVSVKPGIDPSFSSPSHVTEKAALSLPDKVESVRSLAKQESVEAKADLQADRPEIESLSLSSRKEKQEAELEASNVKQSEMLDVTPKRHLRIRDYVPGLSPLLSDDERREMLIRAKAQSRSKIISLEAEFQTSKVELRKAKQETDSAAWELAEAKKEVACVEREPDDEKDSLLADLTVLREKIKSLEKEKANLKTELLSLRHEIQTRKDTQRDCKTQMDRIDREKDRHSLRIKEVEQQKGKLALQESAKAELDDITIKLQGLRDSVNNIKLEVNSASKDKEDLSTSLRELRSQKKSAEESFSLLSEECDACKRDIERLTRKQERFHREITSSKEALETLVSLSKVASREKEKYELLAKEARESANKKMEEYKVLEAEYEKLLEEENRKRAEEGRLNKEKEEKRKAAEEEERLRKEKEELGTRVREEQQRLQKKKEEEDRLAEKRRHEEIAEQDRIKKAKEEEERLAEVARINAQRQEEKAAKEKQRLEELRIAEEKRLQEEEQLALERKREEKEKADQEIKKKEQKALEKKRKEEEKAEQEREKKEEEEKRALEEKRKEDERAVQEMKKKEEEKKALQKKLEEEKAEQERIMKEKEVQALEKKRKEEEEIARKKQEEQKRAEEEKLRLKKEQEEKERLAMEEEAKKREEREKAEQERIKVEEEQKRKAAEEQKQREEKLAQEKEKQQKEEEEKKRQAEEKEKQRKEEERLALEKSRKEKEIAVKLKKEKEEEEQRKQKAEKEAKEKAAKEEVRRLQEQKAAEENKQRLEEEKKLVAKSIVEEENLKEKSLSRTNSVQDKGSRSASKDREVNSNGKVTRRNSLRRTSANGEEVVIEPKCYADLVSSGSSEDLQKFSPKRASLRSSLKHKSEDRTANQEPGSAMHAQESVDDNLKERKDVSKESSEKTKKKSVKDDKEKKKSDTKEKAETKGKEEKDLKKSDVKESLTSTDPATTSISKTPESSQQPQASAEPPSEQKEKPKKKSVKSSEKESKAKKSSSSESKEVVIVQKTSETEIKASKSPSNSGFSLAQVDTSNLVSLTCAEPLVVLPTSSGQPLPGATAADQPTSMEGLDELSVDKTLLMRLQTVSEVEDIPYDSVAVDRRETFAGSSGDDLEMQGKSVRRDPKKKPKFSMKLKDLEATKGSRIKLTCSILGSPEPQIEWMKNGFPIQSDGMKYEARQDPAGIISLEVKDLLREDSGEYTCVAKNVHGRASCTADLRVRAETRADPSPPTFTSRIQESYVGGKDELVLDIKISGHPLPRVMWYKDGNKLQSSRYKTTMTEDGHCRLAITSPSLGDAGHYTCHAENRVWKDEISCFVTLPEEIMKRVIPLHVSSPLNVDMPKVVRGLSDQEVLIGGTVIWIVEATGTPVPEAEWLHDGRAIFPSPKIRTSIPRPWEYQLIIYNVTASDLGAYSCRLSNSWGTVRTVAQLSLKSATKIADDGDVSVGVAGALIDRPEPLITAIRERDLVVTCKVAGHPRPKVTWSKGSRDLISSPRTIMDNEGDTYTLIVKKMLSSDSGTYSVEAKNIHGGQKAYFTVRVKEGDGTTDWELSGTAGILKDVAEKRARRFRRDVPGAIPCPPVASNVGQNFVSLSWQKPVDNGGAPIMAYKVEAWLLGEGAQWQELGVSNITYFDVFNLKQDREYLFRITPRNKYGWGEGATTVNPIRTGFRITLPKFVTPLNPQERVLVGSTVELLCEVVGEPTPQISWKKDGMEVDRERCQISSENSKQLLRIEKVIEEDQGKYLVEASNQGGIQTSFTSLLVVTDPKILEADEKFKRELQLLSKGNYPLAPQFTMRARDRRIQVSHPVRITCQVVGFPKPEIKWFKEDRMISQDDHYVFWQEENFYTLEIQSTRFEDSGTYKIEAANSLGAVRSQCHLVVDGGIKAYISPLFMHELEDRIILEGGTLHLVAKIDAYPVVGVTWHRDGLRLRPSRKYTMTIDRDGTVTLEVSHFTSRDAGTYTCTVTNEMGQAESSAKVTVKPKVDSGSGAGSSGDKLDSQVPRFLKKPRSTEVLEGETLIIVCEVTGDPKPEIVWLRDFLKPGYFRDADCFVFEGEGPEYRLEIPCVKLDHTGTYSVIARNMHGEAKAVLSVQVKAKDFEDAIVRQTKLGTLQTIPEVIQPLRDLRCCDGDSVTFECRVRAQPPPYIRWTKSGKSLNKSKDFEETYDGEVARLHIHQVYPEDEGEYTCVTYNDLGKVSTSACLVVDIAHDKENDVTGALDTRPQDGGGAFSNFTTPRTTPLRCMRSASPVVLSSPLPRRRNYTEELTLLPRQRMRATAPKFYAVPHNRIAEVGDTVRFQCAVAGHPVPKVTWDKDHISIHDSDRFSFEERNDIRIMEIRNVQPEDAGLYRVTVENDLGRVQASARLDIISKSSGNMSSVSTGSSTSSRLGMSSPFFSRRITSTSSRLGGTASFRAEIRGGSLPRPSWYHNFNKVISGDKVTVSQNGAECELVIANVNEEDYGLVTCVLEFEGECESCSALLLCDSDIEGLPPTIVRGLEDITVKEKEEVDLAVEVKGSEPIRTIWVCDGEEIDGSDCTESAGIRKLHLSNPKDGGVYVCEAYNAFGEAESWCHVRIGDKKTRTVLNQFSFSPFFIQPLRNVIVEEGERIEIAVSIEGYPTPSVNFEVNGQILDIQDSRFSVEHQGNWHTLSIFPALLTDNGVITCTASNARGTVSTDCTVSVFDSVFERINKSPEHVDSAYKSFDSDSFFCPEMEGATDLVGVPAEIINEPSDMTVLRGEEILLSVEYLGLPEPTVAWLKCGKVLEENDRVKIEIHDGVSQLRIADANENDCGKYIVVAANGFGSDCRFASVNVEGVPAPPGGAPNIGEVRFGSAVLSWYGSIYDGGSAVTGYVVEAREEFANEWSVAIRCNSTSAKVLDLKPRAFYQFRVRAVNKHGESEPSLETDLICLEDGPPQRKISSISIFSEDDYDGDCPFAHRWVKCEDGSRFAERYSVHDELGKGRFGVVHRAYNLEIGQARAAKVVRCIKQADKEKVKEEIKIMNMLQHKKLLQLEAAFEFQKEIILVTELVSGGELFERVVADDFTLTEKDAILFMRQICEGVQYMHQQDIVHLDLKPENILCVSPTSHSVKIIDFGLARKLNPDVPVRVLFGTPEFIPPEIVSYEPISLASDMWAVGVICYVLLSGLSPFMGENDTETFANITRADFDFCDEAFRHISTEAKQFIAGLLVKKPELRLSASDCLKYKWLAQAERKMKTTRISTEKLKKFIVRRKWQKTGTAIRALGRITSQLSSSRRNSSVLPSRRSSHLVTLREEIDINAIANLAVVQCRTRSPSLPLEYP